MISKSLNDDMMKIWFITFIGAIMIGVFGHIMDDLIIKLGGLCVMVFGLGIAITMFIITGREGVSVKLR